MSAPPAGTVAWRCTGCGRVLAYYIPPVVWLRVRCKKCGAWNVLTMTNRAA